MASTAFGCTGVWVDDSDGTLAALNQLNVAERSLVSGYTGESFGYWSRASNFGWGPTRLLPRPRGALIQDGESAEVESGCKVTSGSWYDPYTIRTYTDPPRT